MRPNESRIRVSENGVDLAQTTAQPRSLDLVVGCCRHLVPRLSRQPKPHGYRTLTSAAVRQAVSFHVDRVCMVSGSTLSQ